MIITENEDDQGLFLQAAYASDEDIDRVAEFLRNEADFYEQFVVCELFGRECEMGNIVILIFAFSYMSAL